MSNVVLLIQGMHMMIDCDLKVAFLKCHTRLKCIVDLRNVTELECLKQHKAEYKNFLPEPILMGMSVTLRK